MVFSHESELVALKSDMLARLNAAARVVDASVLCGPLDLTSDASHRVKAHTVRIQQLAVPTLHHNQVE